MKVNHVFLACLLFASVVSGQTTNCVVAPPGLVGWWRAESNRLDTVSQLEATYSGIQSPATHYTNGQVGAAFRISQRSYFIAPQRTELDVGAGGGFAVEGWINPDALEPAQTFAEWNDGRGNIGAGMTIYTNVLLAFLTDTNASPARSIVLKSPTGMLRSRVWQHVALTYDRTSGLVKLFHNGISVAQTNVGLFRAQTQAPLYMGFRRSGALSGGYYAGGLDELSVYNRALSDVGILGLYAAGSAGKCAVIPGGCSTPPSGLVSWWRAEPDKSVGENVILDNWGANKGTSFISMQYTTGRVGQAFNLRQNFVRVPDALSLRFTNALTIEAWVRPTNVTATLQSIVAKFDPPPTARPQVLTSGYYLGITNGGNLVFRLSANGSSDTNTTLLSTQRIPSNQWSHVVATFGAGAMRLFINGQEDTKRLHAGGVFPGNADLGLGAMVYELGSGSGTALFNGLLDEVSLYNRELSEFEVQALYAANAAGKCLVRPTIVNQPQNQAAPLGEDAKFVVIATGVQPLRYQWYFKQLPVAGATNASLVLEKLKTSQAGPYQVRVTNAFGLEWSTGVNLTLTPAPGCTTTRAGLISWWPADGNGADAMGTNNATALASISYVTGKVDRAFGFNGISSRLQVVSSPSLNFNTNADFSIEMWIKAGASNTTYANMPLFEKLGSIANAPFPGAAVGYSLALNHGRLAFSLGALKGQTLVASNYISSGPDLRDAMFHHVAVTVNRRVTNGGNLYVDGQLVLNFDAAQLNGNLTTVGPLTLGAPSATKIESYFGGLIDEPAIYGRALSAAEILAIRNAGAAGRCKVRPFIVQQPVSQRVTIGSNVTFIVVADGSPQLRYQWLKTGNTIVGATNTTYSFVMTEGSAGSYALRVTNLFGLVMSSNAVLVPNHRPTVGPVDVSLSEDATASVTFKAGDSDQDPLTLVILQPPVHGVLTGTLTNLVYTPALNYFGPDGFTFKVNDGLADSFPSLANITVRSVNDAPVALPQIVSLDEDAATTITLGGFDVEGDALTFATGLPTHGTLNGTPPNLIYRPATNYFGPDSFTFSVSDGKTNSNLATVNLTVRPVNDVPMASIAIAPLLTNVPGVTNLVVLAAACDDAQVVFDGSGSTDVENDLLSFTWLDGTNIVATGKLTTNALPVGSHEISVQVSDGQAVGTAAATVEVISPAQGVGIVIVLLHESDLSRRNLQPLVASLKSAAAAFDQCNARPGVNQLEAFKHKVRAQVAPVNQELADQLIAVVDQIIAAAR